MAPRSQGLLAGKTAVITGTATGIGLAMARVFVAEGARVLAADIEPDQTQALAALGDAAVAHRVDVSDDAQVEAMFARAASLFGRLDILVNNAAVVGGVQPDPLADYDRMTAVNLRGLLLCCNGAIPLMLEGGGGAIVNVSSISAVNTERHTSVAYAAVKSGVVSITKSLAFHHGPAGIRVNAIAPGHTRTERLDLLPSQWHDVTDSKAPLGRAARTEEQAHVAAFLASDRASFVTGVTVPVDGGWSARLA